MNNVNIVIPAAGLATRLRPLTSNISKSMVRVNGKPAISYILDHLYENYKIEQVVIVDGVFNDIREFVSSHYNNKNIKFIKQGKLLGPRDAIDIGISELDNVNIPLIVWLGDTLVFDKNLPFGEDFLLTKQIEDQSQWCVWDGLNKFINKPSFNNPNNFCLVGIYGFYDTLKASKAFKIESYDISDALIKFGYQFKNIKVNEWHDIGDLTNYYKTCGALLNSKGRDFNKFEYDSELNVIIKTPNYTTRSFIEKIKNEKNWYQKLDDNQKLFVPKIVNDQSRLIMSYESGNLVSDLFKYEKLTENTIEHILEKIFKIMTTYFHKPETDYSLIEKFPENTDFLWNKKSKERLNTVKSKVISDYFNYHKIQSIINKSYPVKAMHGDLHTGNIIFNPFNDQITLIDPRGEFGNFIGTHGDGLYDWAKLSHDILFGYNNMLDSDKNNSFIISYYFAKLLKKYNLPMMEIIDGGALLLATCIPLHYDNPERQLRFKNKVESYIENRLINDPRSIMDKL
jgi:dTDP-glucose pyrophosphorylase